MSDPFDDESFFSDIDITALDECEARAIQATQAVKPKVREHGNTTRYHHTVASPRPELIKEPRPLNTEPRAGGKSTFGFGEGGKHTHPANETRLVENVRKRKEYWNLRRDDDDEEYDRPAVTVDPTGRYGLVVEDDEDDGEDDLVDLHAPGARTHALKTKGSFAHPDLGSQGALARRAAIAEAARIESTVGNRVGSLASVQAGHVRQNSLTGHPTPRHTVMPGPSRFLSRSVSVGSHVLAQTRQGPPRALSPVLSQSSPNLPPSSQGSQLRRSAFELEDGKRQREGLEARIKQLNDELAKSKSARTHWADGLPDGDEGGDHSEHKLKSLQTDLWIAKGEAETMRRAQKEEANRHIAETERLRRQIADMQAAIADKERENIVRMENVKSQAIFATHAAFNSTSKSRPHNRAANRPVTPTKSQNGSPAQRLAKNGTPGPEFGAPTKRDRPLAAQPMFGKLANGFATNVKVKRAYPDIPQPFETDRGDIDRDIWREEPDDFSGHHHGGDVTEGPADVATGTLPYSYVHHVMNYAHTFQPLASSSRQPAVYRIIRFRPPERETEYATCCSQLLQACAAETAVPQMTADIGAILVHIFSIIIDTTVLPLTTDMVSLLLDTLGLLSSSLFMFPHMVDGDLGHQLSVATRRLVGTCLNSKIIAGDKVDDSQRSVESRLAHDTVLLCEGLCWLTGLRIWAGDDLAFIITTLSSPTQNHSVVERAIDLLRAASCTGLNLRAVTASLSVTDVESRDTNGIMPVVERVSRYLMTPHTEWTDAKALSAQMTIIHAIGGVCLEDADATLLLAQQSSLIPAIIVLLHRHSAKILGVEYGSHASMRVIQLLSAALYLLHHLVFPSPLRCRPRTQKLESSSQRYFPAATPNRDVAVYAPQGVDLQARLLSASSVKEWSGLQHMFVSALGSLAYCDFVGQSVMGDEGEVDVEVEWRTLQYISQDLLESVVEGPEADEIYEMYFNGIETTSSLKTAQGNEVDDTDEDGYAAMRDVITIE